MGLDAAYEAERKRLGLPEDISKEELDDFKNCGELELYNLNREGAKLNAERIKLNKEIADRHYLEADKRAKRHQLEQQRLDNEALKRKLIAPPPPDPYADSKPLRGSENLPEVAKGVLRRLFGMHNGEWTPQNQQGLVDLLLAMGPARASEWAHQTLDALQADVYMSNELSPKAILRGSTGLKQIAGPSLMPDLKAIGGPVDDDDVKQVSDGRRKKKRKKKRKDGEKSSVRQDAHEDDAEEEHEGSQEVIDDSPMGNSDHNPWGDGGFSH